MASLGRTVTIVVCSLVYAFVGVAIGVTTGFIVLKFAELAFDTEIVFTGIGQSAVAAWALLLATGAVTVYLRSPLGDRRPARRP